MLKLILIFLCVYYVEGQIVNTNQGQVRGVEEDGYTAYLGIPYATVDVGNPFGPSSPHPHFEGIFDAVDDSAICPQVEEFNGTLTGSLDCLHLSVFVPEGNEPLPVLVWIFGGRFELGFFGRYLYGPKYLVRHGIILVTLNYRLGPYGFMCTDDPRVPGNQGFKDQMLALQWVHENIANFGGDPSKVTIAGNSAGGMSSDFQILRNHEPRLFQQAVMQSGTSLCLSFPNPDKEAPLKLARHFGYETNIISTALDFLSAIDPLDMIEASNLLQLEFRPCIEERFEGVETFIDFNWFSNDSLPFAKDLNVMIGFNNEENLMGALRFPNPNIVPDTLRVHFNTEHEDFQGEELVKEFFFGDEVIEDDLQGNIDFRSDMSFIQPTLRSLDKFLRNEVAKAYLYKFSYKGGRNFVSQRNNLTIGGASHADEIGYLFDIEYFEEPTVEDQLVLDRMTEMWANFVKYNDPTPQTTSLLPTQWQPITPTTYNYMEIGSNLEAKNRPYQERQVFWDMFYEKNGHLHWSMLEGGRKVDKKFLDDLFLIN